jgi:DNA-binding NarL/FixJ family response regulator
MIKVLIADDHAILREGVRQILAETKDIVVADEAANGQEVLDRVSKKKYDVIVLDINMPGRNGLEVLKEVKARQPDLPVIILSMYPTEQYGVRVFKLGASGYLTKDVVSDELITAIRKVYMGGRYINPVLAEKLAAALSDKSPQAPHEALSDREYQVLCMIGAGKSTKHIAQELSLSVKTVSTYRTRILEKMKMENNAELTRYVIENRLVQ